MRGEGRDAMEAMTELLKVDLERARATLRRATDDVYRARCAVLEQQRPDSSLATAELALRAAESAVATAEAAAQLAASLTPADRPRYETCCRIVSNAERAAVFASNAATATCDRLLAELAAQP